MGKSSIEITQFIYPSRKLDALAGQDDLQFSRDFIAPTGGTEGGYVGSLCEREVKLPKSDQEAQPRDVGVGVIPVAVVAALHFRQQAIPFVEADRVRRRVESGGYGSYAHGRRLDPGAALMSSPFLRIASYGAQPMVPLPAVGAQLETSAPVEDLGVHGRREPLAANAGQEIGGGHRGHLAARCARR